MGIDDRGRCGPRGYNSRRQLGRMGLALREVPQRREILWKGFLRNGFRLQFSIMWEPYSRSPEFVFELSVLHFLKISDAIRTGGEMTEIQTGLQEMWKEMR